MAIDRNKALKSAQNIDKKKSQNTINRTKALESARNIDDTNNKKLYGENYRDKIYPQKTNTNPTSSTHTTAATTSRSAADERARKFVIDNGGEKTAYIGTGANGSTTNYAIQVQGTTAGNASSSANNQSKKEDIPDFTERNKLRENQTELEKFQQGVTHSKGSDGAYRLEEPFAEANRASKKSVKKGKPETVLSQMSDKELETLDQIIANDKSGNKADYSFESERIKRRYGIDSEQFEWVKTQRVTKLKETETTQKYADVYNNMSADAKALLSFIVEEDTAKTNSQISSVLAAMTGSSGYLAENDEYYNHSKSTSQQARQLLKELYGMSDDEINAAVLFHNRSINAENASKNNAEAEKFAIEHPVISSVASVPMSVAGNVFSPIGTIMDYGDVQKAKELGMGDIGLDRNNTFRTFTNMSQSIRQEFTDTHDLKIGNYDVGDLLYNTAMSGADSLVSMAMGGTVGGVVLGLGAATETAQELSDRGIGTNKAVVGGLVAGVFEGLFERVSIGNFKALQETSVKGAKDLVGNIAKSMLVNASEEGATEIANIAYDTLANGGLSQYAMAVNYYTQNGKTAQEAKMLAAKELALQVGESALSGAIMGAGFGAIGSVSGAAKYDYAMREYGNAVKASGQNAAKIEAGKASTDGKIQKAAENIKVKKNGDVSSRKIGKLSYAIDSAVEEAAISAKDNRFASFQSIDELESAYNETIKKLNERYGSNPAELKARKAYVTKEYNQIKNVLSMAEAAKNASDKLVKADERTLSKEDRFDIVHPEIEIDGEKAHIDGQTVGENNARGEFKGIFEKDGEKFIKTEDGREMKLSDAAQKITDGNIRELWSEAAKMSAEAANLFIDNYDGQAISEYKSAFEYYHNLGRTGMSAEQIRAKDTIFGTYLTKRAQQNIAASGLKSREFRSGVTDMSVSKATKRFKYEKSVLEALGKKYGTEFIILDESSKVNGQYLTGTNRIVLYRNADANVMLRSAGHEVYHFVEKYSSEQAKEIESFVLNALKENGVDVEAAIAGYEKYKSEDGKMTYATRESRISELVADSMFDVFVDKKFADKLAKEDRSFAKKLSNHIGNIISEMKRAIAAFAAGKDKIEIKALYNDIEKLDKIRDMLLEGLDKASENFKAREQGKKNSNEKIEKKYSFADARGKSDIVAQADLMERDGATRDEIWQKLGLIRDASGTWVYEIDDSGFKIYPRGDALIRQESGYKRMMELFNKAYVDCVELTDSERNEYLALDKKYQSTDNRHAWKLEDYVEHDELFKTYPELRKATFRFNSISENTNGYYDWFNNKIVISDKYIKDIYHLSKTAIHEIQHAIQSIDGRAGGASPEYYKEQQSWYRLYAKSVNDFLKNNGLNDFAKASMQEVTDGKKSLENHWEDLKKWKENTIDEKGSARIQSHYNSMLKYEKYMTDDAENLYFNTAGEIEARETANRSHLTAEERAKKTPDLGWERAVVADRIFSMKDSEYSEAVKNGDTEKAQKIVDEAAKAAGYNYKLYHQTGNDFTVFDTRHQGAGTGDSGTPFGIFMKPTSNDIGLKGQKQMPVFASINNPLVVKDRENLMLELKKDKAVKNAQDKIEKVNTDYKKKVDQAGKELQNYLIEYRKNHPDEPRREIYNDKGFNDIHDREKSLIDEWTLTIDKISVESKSAINEYLLNNGYDGVIIEHDAGSFGRKTKAYIALNNTQVKSAEAVTYDDDGKVIPLSERFKENNQDIRFSMKESVEDNGELIAVHNISFDKLLKSLDLGGLAMPSIAVTKAKMGHSQFGDISLVFRKETIDPRKNYNNRIYSSDAYTPTFPSIEYKANEKVHDKLRDTYYELYRKYGNEDTRPLYDYVYEIEDKLKYANGDTENIINDLKDNKDLMNLYIRISGKERVEPIYTEKVSRLSDKEIELYDSFISAIGKDTISNVNLIGFGPAKKWCENNIDIIKEAYVKSLAEAENISEQEAQSKADNTSVRDLTYFVRNVLKYLKRGAETVTTEYDAEATKKKILETVDQKGYEKWLHGLFDGIYEKKGIPNGKDPFTKSGNRKSFEALHWEYSLENIVEAMKSENAKGNALMGLPSIYGAASTEFDSIDDIRASKDKLKNINNEEFESKRKEFNERFFAIAESLCKYKNWETSNAVEQILVEALNKFNTRQEIESYVRKEIRGFGNYNKNSMDSFFELVSDIQAMPTDYFEAKPERAVGFDEVEFAVIPDNTPQEIIDRLQELGVETREYKAGDENARTQALNSKPDILFSSKEPSDIDRYVADNIRDNRNYRMILTLLDDMQYSSSKGNVHLNSSDINRIAGKILKKVTSKYDRAKLNDELTVIYDYMANNKTAGGVNTEELIGMFMNISKRILDKSEMRDTGLWEQYSEVRSFLKGQAVYITPAVKKEIESQYGDYKTFRNLLMGKMNRISTTNSDAMTLDEVWKELSDRAPEYFPEDTNELEMPMRLAAFYDAIAPKVVNPYEHYDANIEEACALLATDLYSEYFNVGRIKTDREKVRDILDDGMRQLAESKKKMKEDFRRKAAQNEQENYERYKTKVTEYKIQREQGDRRRRERAQLEKNYNYINRRLVRETDRDHIPENIKPLAEAFKGIIPDGTEKFSESKFTKFENEYRKLENVSPFFDEDMIDTISNLKDRLTKGLEIPRMRDISNAEVSALRDISEHIKHIVQGENRLFSDNLKGTRDNYAQRMHGDLASKPESRNQGVGENATKADKIRNGVNKFIKGLTKPEYLFESLGETGYRLYQNIRNGENVEAKFIYDAKIAEQDIKRRNNFDSRWAHETVTLKLRSGNINVTVGQAMSLFATSKRKQGIEHLLNGGAVLYTSKSEADGKKNNGKRQKIVFKEDDFTVIQKALTTDQKNYVNEMVEYITKEIGSKRNEVSMKLYGIEKYKEEYYFPIKVDNNFIDSQLGKQEVVSTIKNQSSSKRTVNKANNPIAISDFTETVNQHIYDSALYCAYVTAIEDFKQVFNYREKYYEGEGAESLLAREISVKDDIRRALGINAVKEIEQFMVALDSGSRYENLMPLSGKLASRAKKTAVMANLSVVVQQPTAIFRSMLYINPKYYKTLPSKADIQEMKQWNGCALKKEIGYFDVNMGRTATDYLNEYSTDKDIKKDWSLKDRVQNGNYMMKLDQVAGWGANKADEMTWGAIWNACKNQTKAENPGLSGDNLKAKAAELFQEAIAKTQVYDSVFTKPEYMRRKEGFAMMATAFMSEPLTSLNMLADSVVKAKNAKGTGRQKQAYKFTAKAFSCYVASIVFNSAIKSVVYSLRDDDDDESFLEKYIANFTESVVTDPFQMVPYLKDIITLLQGYDLNRIDVAVFGSFKKAAEALLDDNKPTFDKIMAVIKAGGQASGIPLYNVVRDGKAIFDIFTTVTDGIKNGFEPTTGKGIINELKETFDYSSKLHLVEPEGKYDQLFNAIEDGDEKHYNKVYNNLIAEGRTDDTINSELASRLAENDSRIAAAFEATLSNNAVEASDQIVELKEAGFSDEVINKALNRYMNNLTKELSDDSRVLQAAQARYDMNYDEYERLIDEIVGDGYSEVIVKEAINKEKIALETEENGFEINEKDSFEASYDLKNAMINGGASEVKRVHSELSAEFGKEKADEYVRDYAKDAYRDKKITAYQAEKYLKDYKKADADDNDVFWEVEKMKGGDDYRKYGKLYNAIESGNNLDGTISFYTEHGVTIKSIRDSITSEYKPKLLELTPGTSEYNEMYDNVIEAIVATGKSYSEARKQVNKWFK